MSKQINWDEYPNFTRKEFVADGPEMKKVFMDKLQLARLICNKLCKEAGIPEISFYINSGSRSKKHNQQVGGTEESTHLFGCAADIRAWTSREKFFIVKSLMLAGFLRILIYERFIHVDCGEILTEVTKNPYVIKGK